jgi:hypothetical protein
MTLGSPFAIATSVTLGGIVEEHNAAPIRSITFSGTFGVLPARPMGEALSRPNFAQAIFGGTIGGFQAMVESGRRTFQAAGAVVDITDDPTLRSKPNLLSDDERETVDPISGYAQWRNLQKFLEIYVHDKKTPEGRDLRLAVAIWKDQAVYLVTPVSFDTRRTSASPLEYEYSLQFKAWKRVRLNGPGDYALERYVPPSRDANTLARVFNTFREARETISNAKNLISAVGRDLDQSIYRILREIILLAKDALGVPLSLADMPFNLADQMIREVSRFVNDAMDVGEAAMNVPRAMLARGESRAASTMDNLSQALSPATAAKGGPMPAWMGSRGQRLTSDQQQLIQRIKEEHIDISDTDNPVVQKLLDTVNIGDLELSPASIRKVAEARAAVRNLSRPDFVRMRDLVITVTSDVADTLGVGHEGYDATYGRERSRVNKSVATPDDMEVLYALNDCIIALDKLAFSRDIDRATLEPIEFVAGLAQRSGIAFQVPRSKFAVPFPYDTTLEWLARRYLNDPDRWMEIAELNGLREPYVDEEGFDLPLLVHGKGRDIVVADSSNLYIGQILFIGSDSVVRTKRRIVKIDKISESQSIITVDGEADLDQYLVGHRAKASAFLPGTVNSQMMIYIPSDAAPTEDDWKTKQIPGVDEFAHLKEVGGVDLLLTADGDIAMTPDGDNRLAVGLNNLIQRVRVAVGTRKGSLIRHPDFGLGIEPGTSTAEVDVKTLIQAVRDLFAGDPDFTGVEAAVASKDGPVAQISLAVGVRGVSSLIPVTVNLE